VDADDIAPGPGNGPFVPGPATDRSPRWPARCSPSPGRGPGAACD